MSHIGAQTLLESCRDLNSQFLYSICILSINLYAAFYLQFIKKKLGYKTTWCFANLSLLLLFRSTCYFIFIRLTEFYRWPQVRFLLLAVPVVPAEKTTHDHEHQKHCRTRPAIFNFSCASNFNSNGLAVAFLASTIVYYRIRHIFWFFLLVFALFLMW